MTMVRIWCCCEHVCAVNPAVASCLHSSYNLEAGSASPGTRGRLLDCTSHHSLEWLAFELCLCPMSIALTLSVSPACWHMDSRSLTNFKECAALKRSKNATTAVLWLFAGVWGVGAAPRIIQQPCCRSSSPRCVDSPPAPYDVDPVLWPYLHFPCTVFQVSATCRHFTALASKWRRRRGLAGRHWAPCVANWANWPLEVFWGVPVIAKYQYVFSMRRRGGF